MIDDVDVELIAIGTEILLGEITDTNSVYLARLFRDLGVNVHYMTTVGDNAERIAAVIKHACQRSHIVITCGGLGPTVDDMTRDGVAAATTRELVFDDDLLAHIQERFESYGVTMTDNNRRQAFVPDGAKTIHNPVGTAPGFIIEDGETVIISLPGVPRELKFLMQNTVIPYLRERYKLGIIKSRTLKTAGIGESTLDDMLGDDILEGANPTVGLAAHHGVIDIRITAKADNESQAAMLLDQSESDIRQRAGQFIFGTDEDTLESVLVRQLVESESQIGVIEGGLTGAVSDIIRRSPFRDVLVSYSLVYDTPDEATQHHSISDVGLRRQAVLLARQMADQCRANIVILSLPDVEESADIEEATAVVVLVDDEIRVRTYGFGVKSKLAREWVGRWALATTWCLLQDSMTS